MALGKIGTNQLGTGSDTDAITLPSGTTAQRPSSPVAGMIRYNTTGSYIEEYRNGSWTVLSDFSSGAGGTVTTYSSGGVNYKVHTFTSSGTFTVVGSLSIDYLVVAGGGGGGHNHGGGGGAGGLLTGSKTAAAGAYTVTVGAGGAGGASSGAAGGQGGASSAVGVFNYWRRRRRRSYRYWFNKTVGRMVATAGVVLVQILLQQGLVHLVRGSTAEAVLQMLQPVTAGVVEVLPK